ncbi:MAG TPA: hypothetical protein V6D05_17725 [Stenomitos sp.]
MSTTATTPASLSRRIKQHVHAPLHTWFAPCPPGFEPVVAQELRDLEAEDVVPEAGGVAFRGKLEVGYRANLWLRAANRVLLRLAEFRAKRPEELFRHARGLYWEAFLALDVPLRFSISTYKSWLKHEGMLEATLRDAIRRRLEEVGLDTAVADLEPAEGEDPLVQRLMVRLEEDRLTLSLDTTGEHLHRRGYRQATAKAPLRENLAAGLLLTAGYDGERPLVDPMCGSGTLAIEAAFIARRLPPGAHRSFLFERWPSFRAATWAHLKKKALEEALPAAPAPIVARDTHGGALRAAEANAERAGVSGDLVLEQADFFQASPPEGAGWVVMNPPYGLRVGESEDIRALYRRIGGRLRSAYAGWDFALLVPEARLIEVLGLPAEPPLWIPHGGLKVAVVRGKVPV